MRSIRSILVVSRLDVGCYTSPSSRNPPAPTSTTIPTSKRSQVYYGFGECSQRFEALCELFRCKE